MQLSEWFRTESSLPEDIAKERLVWELVLNVIIQSKDRTISANCMEALNIIIEDGSDADKEEFASLTWGLLPEVLSKALIDSHDALLGNTHDYNSEQINKFYTKHKQNDIGMSILFIVCNQRVCIYFHIHQTQTSRISSTLLRHIRQLRSNSRYV